ncbi:hypothetical protein RCO48_35690 [Peribacillus frigoritolerans]|nr:hypothetical protein [Peribacillus frigoritolerans]
MIGTEGTRLLRKKARLRGDHAGESRGGSPTARGKRVLYFQSTSKLYKP